jgi:ubiquinone/menaquinone biosynthesis C-methylase UbiE
MPTLTKPKPAPTAEQLKEAIRERWSLPQRVDGWTSSGLNADFADDACRRAWKDALRRAAAGAPLRTALDLGTGPGTIAQLWAELSAKTTGVDFSPGMIDAARALAAEKNLPITFLEGDAEAPPLSKKRFDVISSRFVLFTLPHPGYAVRRWVEMLAPEGRLVLIGHEHPEGSRPRRGHRPPARAKLLAVDKRHREALSHLPFMDHTSGDLRVVMEAAGLKDIERVPVDELVAARAALRKRKRSLGINPSAPFILVGRK